MSREGAVLFLVAQRMQDADEIRKSLADSIAASIRDGDESHILIDIANAIREVNRSDSVPAQWETVATRLLYSLERYARAALTAAAEDETPEDDEDDET